MLPPLTPLNQHTITPQFFGSRVTNWIRVYGVPFTVWRPDHSIDGLGKPLELPLAQQGTSIGLFMQKNPQRDAPTAIGVTLSQDIVLIFPKEDEQLIRQRDYVLDLPGNIWLVQSFPDRQRLGAGVNTTADAIIGCVVDVVLQSGPPPGLPLPGPDD